MDIVIVTFALWYYYSTSVVSVCPRAYLRRRAMQRYISVSIASAAQRRWKQAFTDQVCDGHEISLLQQCIILVTLV